MYQLRSPNAALSHKQKLIIHKAEADFKHLILILMTFVNNQHTWCWSEWCCEWQQPVDWHRFQAPGQLTFCTARHTSIEVCIKSNAYQAINQCIEHSADYIVVPLIHVMMQINKLYFSSTVTTSIQIELHKLLQGRIPRNSQPTLPCISKEVDKVYSFH